MTIFNMYILDILFVVVAMSLNIFVFLFPLLCEEFFIEYLLNNILYFDCSIVNIEFKTIVYIICN